MAHAAQTVGPSLACPPPRPREARSRSVPVPVTAVKLEPPRSPRHAKLSRCCVSLPCDSTSHNPRGVRSNPARDRPEALQRWARQLAAQKETRRRHAGLALAVVVHNFAWTFALLTYLG